jgi:hypothetical protein
MKLVAPAFPNENSFYCRFFAEVGSYLDEDQRRLHEVDFRHDSTADSYGKCPFADSRRGYVMNKAALRQIASQWDNIVAGVHFFAALAGRMLDDELALERAWRITMMTMFAPLYLVKRRIAPVADGSLPVALAGVFKIMLDVPTTIDLMVLTAARPHDTNWNWRDIRDFADKNLILLNGEYACAGSPALMDEVLRPLFGEPEAERDSSSPLFRSYLPDRREFLVFVHYMSCQYLAAFVYQLTTARAMELAFTELMQSGAFIPHTEVEESRPSAYERRRRIALRALIQANESGEIFAPFGRLAKHGERGSSSADPYSAVLDFLETSRSFLESVADATAPEVSHLHRRYQAEFRGWLELHQPRIEAAIGATRLFSAGPFFGPSPLLPCALLANIIESQQCTAGFHG